VFASCVCGDEASGVGRMVELLGCLTAGPTAAQQWRQQHGGSEHESRHALGSLFILAVTLSPFGLALRARMQARPQDRFRYRSPASH
jgi:hypothetical protein